MDQPSTPPTAAEAAPLYLPDVASTAQAAHNLADLAEQIHANAERCACALGALLQLLRGCADDHTLTASWLAELVEPVVGQADDMAIDLASLWNVVALMQRPGSPA